jgi:hypothetical protein
MRLTLRTLLAWMDDVLPQEEQRQLGEKVEASGVARQLVERIRACVANPHLSSPRVEGKGLAADADSVAEYLDNTLPTDRLEAFETICLESDMHLAEVAACHHTLAEVAKNPAVLPPLDAAHRRRLLEAMRHRIAAHPEVTPRSDGRTVEPRRPDKLQPSLGGQESPAARRSSPVGEVATAAQPSKRPARKSAWTASALAASALLLLAVLAALLAQSVGLFRAPAGPRADLAANGPKNVAVDRPDAVVAGEVAALPGAEHAVAAPATDGPAVATAPLEEPARGLADLLARADHEESALPADDPAAVADPEGTREDNAAEPDMAAAAEPAGPPLEALADVPRKVRAGEALAIAGGVRPRRPAKPPGGAEGKPDDDVAGAVGLENDQGEVAESLGFVAADGVILRQVVDGDRSWWVPIGVGAPLGSSETLVVPPGMHPELNIGGVSVRVLPRSQITLLGSPDGTPVVGVERGRIVARGGRADARLGIVVGGLAGTVTAGLEGAVMAEGAIAWKPGLGASKPALIGEVIAVGRELRWTPTGEAAAVEVPARGGLRWDSATPDTISLLPPKPVAAWGIGGERIDPLERGAAEAFAARLAALPQGSPSAAGLDEVTLTMAIDRRVENRIFAAILLALEGSYDVAVESLCAEAPGRRLEGRQWLGLEAAVIPLALGRGPESSERLRKAWEDHGPAGRAELLMALARGPDDTDLAGGADATLVEALSAAELVIRRYALKDLVEIVEPSVFDRSRFRPDAPEEARRDGVVWWRSLQEKGLVRRGE